MREGRSQNDDMEQRETEKGEGGEDVFEMLKTDHRHVQDLFTKFRAQATTWELRDWFNNIFHVVFAPGQASFRATPIRGSCTSFEYQMTLYVTRVVQWFGGSF